MRNRDINYNLMIHCVWNKLRKFTVCDNAKFAFDGHRDADLLIRLPYIKWKFLGSATCNNSIDNFNAEFRHDERMLIAIAWTNEVPKRSFDSTLTILIYTRKSLLSVSKKTRGRREMDVIQPRYDY